MKRERKWRAKEKWWIKKSIVKIDLMATSSQGSRHRLAPLIHWLLCRWAVQICKMIEWYRRSFDFIFKMTHIYVWVWYCQPTYRLVTFMLKTLKLKFTCSHVQRLIFFLPFSSSYSFLSSIVVCVYWIVCRLVHIFDIKSTALMHGNHCLSLKRIKPNKAVIFNFQ